MTTRANRSSALSLVPWLATLPPADASMDQADRQHLAFVYRGILAAVSLPITIYPDPFAATATASVSPFLATSTTTAAVNPFAATSRIKGS